MIFPANIVHVDRGLKGLCLSHPLRDREKEGKEERKGKEEEKKRGKEGDIEGRKGLASHAVAPK